MLCILKSLAAWLGIMLLSTNLFSFFVRGLFPPALPIEGSTDRVTELLTREARKVYLASVIMTLIGLALSAGFVYSLYHYWNWGLALASGLFMVSHLPDLLWEIKNGRKPLGDDQPEGGIYVASGFVPILLLPLVWYALCMWK